MVIIADINAREILDSRGNPTVEADVILANGVMGRAAVPSGASTGEHEAIELRDGDKRALPRQGRAERPCRTSRRRSPRRSPACDATDQIGDRRALIELDGTPNKAKLGANAILAVSLATARAAAQERRPAAVALPRRSARARDAGADDEHPQRRRARDEHRRLPGVHDRPRRRGDRSPRRCAWAPRCSTR